MEKNGLQLLVVDDEEASRYGIKRALETFGAEIAEVGIERIMKERRPVGIFVALVHEPRTGLLLPLRDLEPRVEQIVRARADGGFGALFLLRSDAAMRADTRGEDRGHVR